MLKRSTVNPNLWLTGRVWIWSRVILQLLSLGWGQFKFTGWLARMDSAQTQPINNKVTNVDPNSYGTLEGSIRALNYWGRSGSVWVGRWVTRNATCTEQQKHQTSKEHLAGRSAQIFLLKFVQMSLFYCLLARWNIIMIFLSYLLCLQ